MKIDPIAVLGAATVIVGAIANHNPQQQAITAATDSIVTNAVASEVATEALATQSQLAESRYKSGLCIISTISIVEGLAVPPAHAGQVICDAQGMTATIATNGALVLLARTGNTTIISEGLK